MKNFLWLFFLVSSVALAQSLEDIRFIETSDSVSSPFSIPVDIDTHGKVSIIKDLEGNFILSPLGQLKYNRNIVNYVAPVTSTQFSLTNPYKNEWIEVKTKKIEIGLGPSAEIAKVVTVGLMPYKGALQTTMRHKNSKDETKEKISLSFGPPKNLSDIEDWAIRDQGLFQTVGGIQAYVSAGIGFINFGSVSFFLQNKFVVSVKKLSASLVEVKITEENMNKRQLTVGTVIARAYLGHYKGKLFNSTFTFDLSNSEHHELYRLALKGRLDQVQEKLEAGKQKIEWTSLENSYFAGIPSVMGKYHLKGRYDVDINDGNNELQLVRSENKGLFLPVRNYTRIVWNRAEVMTLFWSSEMKHTRGAVVEKRFLSLGRVMGVSGFEAQANSESSFGSTMTQLALGFTKNELQGLNQENMKQLEFNLRARCEEFELSCRKNKNIRKMMSRVADALNLPWEQSRKELGALFNQEPALVYAVTKSLHLKKEIFFKFLSENYQSIQGVGVIEL